MVRGRLDDASLLSSTGLNLEMLNLYWCRHFDTSSDHLFKRVLLSAFKMDSFSSKQRLHRLQPLLRGKIPTGYLLSGLKIVNNVKLRVAT